MIDTRRTGVKAGAALPKQKSYNEIIDYLDSRWHINAKDKSLERMKALNLALGSVAQKLPAILVAGTNGKSLTVHFTAKLFIEEGMKVGAYYYPHILTYNERFAINNEGVSNKLFSEVMNEVIAIAQENNIDANSNEILAMSAILYFVQQEVDVAILEVSDAGQFDPVNICDAKIATITRVTEKDVKTTKQDIKELVTQTMGIVKQNTWLVSGDQCKENLQLMENLTVEKGGNWAMPIRKLAALPYPFEQLHGRCAALAERLANMFVEKFYNNPTEVIVANSLLSKQKGKRGRPTLEAKQKEKENPKKTVDQLWKETASDLYGRFQLLDKEKPSILLDNASNIDAFENLLLGIRLLHYQKPLKGLAIIVASAKDAMDNEEFLKATRYFFKKTSGQLLACPIEQPLAGSNESVSWDVEKIANDLKGMKVKARACKDFEEAFDIAKKSVDERNGLVVITGSQSIINKYWQHKGIKKL